METKTFKALRKLAADSPNYYQEASDFSKSPLYVKNAVGLGSGVFSGIGSYLLLRALGISRSKALLSSLPVSAAMYAAGTGWDGARALNAWNTGHERVIKTMADTMSPDRLLEQVVKNLKLK